MSTIWGFLRPFGSDCTIFFWTLRWSSFWLVQSYSIHEKKNIFGCWLIPVIFRRTHHNSPFFCSEIPLFSMLNRWKSLGLRRRARGRPTIHVTRHVGGHPEIARDSQREGFSDLVVISGIISGIFRGSSRDTQSPIFSG